VKRLGPAGVAAALLLAAGCAPKARAPEELVFWQLAPPAAMEPIVRRFEAETPGLRVRVVQVARADLADSVAAALAAGRPPDLCELDAGLMRALLPEGALSDWSAGAADQRDSLRGWEACRVGDALYGMPWRISPRVLYWNRALFARAGLDSSRAPETWDALLAAAKRIARLGDGIHGYGLASGDSTGLLPEFLSYAWGNGGEVLSAGEDSSRFDSRANVEALELAVRLRGPGLEADGARLDHEFAGGRLGLRLADGGFAARLEREAPSLRFGVAPVPGRVAGACAPWADVRVLASFVRSRHKEHALRLARFLARPANAVEAFAAHPDGVPANAGADTLEWFRGRPREALLAAEAGRARFAPAHAAWPEMERTIAAALDSTLHGGLPPDSAVAGAGARLAELVGRR
jgi:multiple sugar transport system substrate-binding protein